MDDRIPAHPQNPHTDSTASLQVFDVEAVPLPPGTKASPRPVGRERPRPEDLEAQPERVAVAPTYTALIQKNGAGWLGCVEQLGGVNAQGGTREELLMNLQAALREALEGK